MPSLGQEIKKKVDEVGSAFEEFKKQNDDRLKELEKKGSADVVVVESMEKANGAIEALQNQIEEMKTALNRSEMPGDNEVEDGKSSKEYKSGFLSAMRGKSVQLDEKQAGYKGMSIDSDPDGGYLVPAEMSNEMVKRLFETSPMRQIAGQITISTDRMEILQDLDEADAGWVGERQARPQTDTPTLKKIIIPVEELYAMPSATQRLLDDAAINLEAWLNEKVSEKMMRVENTAFISGNGDQKPRGILSYADAADPDVYEFGKLATIESTNIGVLTEADDFVNLVYQLKEDYLSGASFIMRRQTEKEVRKIKQDNKYIWQPDFANKGQGTLLGYDVRQFTDMGTIAAGQYAVAFGDFRRGYQIVDRLGIRILRDPYTAKPNVLFYTTKRVGGGVKDYDAIKRLKVKA